MRRMVVALLLCAMASGLTAQVRDVKAKTSSARQKIFLDTDIGDDVDDAFALALLLSSPEVEIVGISGAWGDTTLRARMIERFLAETGHAGIPVGAGVKTESKTVFSQREWAEGSKAAVSFPDGVTLLQEAIRKYPGQLTLVALGPLTNIQALVERDPATFRKLKQVVMMGGSVTKGYGSGGPVAEYNIQMAPAAAQALFSAGVPIRMLPLDSTIVQMPEDRRAELYRQGTATTQVLKELDREWGANSGRSTPILFDVVPVATLIDAGVCPLSPLRIAVNDKGFTLPVAGKPNAEVCLKLDEPRFLSLFFTRLLPKP